MRLKERVLTWEHPEWRQWGGQARRGGGPGQDGRREAPHGRRDCAAGGQRQRDREDLRVRLVLNVQFDPHWSWALLRGCQ